MADQQSDQEKSFGTIFNRGFLEGIAGRKNTPGAARNPTLTDDQYAAEIGGTEGVKRTARTVQSWRQRDNTPIPEGPLLREVMRKLVKDAAGQLRREWGEQLVRTAVEKGKLSELIAEEILEDIWPRRDPRRVRDNFYLYEGYQEYEEYGMRRRLIGREHEYKLLMLRLMTDKAPETIIINASGGIGKTALVMEVAQDCYENSTRLRPDTTVPEFKNFIFCTARTKTFRDAKIQDHPWNQRNVGSILRNISSVVGRLDLPRKDWSDYEEWQNDIKAWLELALSEKTLLIVDNYENIENANEKTLVMRLLGLMPATCWRIVTTRESASYCYMDLHPLDKDSSIALAIERAVLEKLDIDENDARKIYIMTSGIPLGIITAVIMKKVEKKRAWSSIAEELTSRRNAYVQFCIEKQLETVGSGIERTLFLTLSMFRSAVDQDDLFQVAGLTHAEAEPALEHLVGLTVVQRIGNRVVMPALQRSVARSERAKDAEFRDRSRKAFNAWCLNLVEQHGREDWHYPNPLSNYRQLDGVWDHLYDCFEWCRLRSDSRSEELQQHAYDLMKAAWLRHLGAPDSYTTIQAKWDERWQSIMWLLRRAEERREWSVAVESMANCAYSLVLQGDTHNLRQAEKLLFRRALPLCGPETPMPGARVRPVTARARALLHQVAGLYWLRRRDSKEALGQFDIADRYIQRAKEDESSLLGKDATAFLINSSYYRALAEFQAGNLEGAITQFDQVGDLSLDIQWRRAATYADANLGRVYIKQGGKGDLSDAETLLNRALEVLEPEDDGQDLSDTRGAAHVRQYLGELSMARIEDLGKVGDNRTEELRKEALRHLEKSAEMFSNIGLKYNEKEVRNLIDRLNKKGYSGPAPSGW